MNSGLKEKILPLVRIEDVISRYLTLHGSGSRGTTLTGLCPFHADRHPSLQVNTQHQYYKCFACGEGGDAFKFVQKIENCSFRQALSRMAGWYGLTCDHTPPPVRLPAQTTPVAKLVRAYSEAEIYAQLKKHYTVACSLTPYIHANPELRDTYLRFGVSLAPDRMPGGFGFLRNRLVFPVCNERGEVVAFSGRYRGDARKDGVAKYINSATSAVYRKSEILYGLYASAEAIRRHHFVYITEGYKDVLAMHAAGFTHTVGLCGTALTSEHAAALRRYTNQVVLLLDGDQAGYQAAVEAARRLRRAGFIVSPVFLSPEHDPDSLLEELGVEAFARSIIRATRYSRLESYAYYLSACQSRLHEELKHAFVPEDRLALLPQLIQVRRRLARVTQKLGHGVCLPPAETNEQQ